MKTRKKKMELPANHGNQSARITALEQELERLRRRNAILMDTRHRLSRNNLALRARIDMPELYLDHRWRIRGYSGNFVRLTEEIIDLAGRQEPLATLIGPEAFARVLEYLERVAALERLDYAGNPHPWRLVCRGPGAGDRIGPDWLGLENSAACGWRIERRGDPWGFYHPPHPEVEQDCYLMSTAQYGGATEDLRVVYRFRTADDPLLIRDLSLVISGGPATSQTSPDTVGYCICTGSFENTLSSIQRQGGELTVVREALEPGAEYEVTVERVGGRIERGLRNLSTGYEHPSLAAIDPQAIYDRLNHVGFTTFAGEAWFYGLEISTRPSRLEPSQFWVPFDLELECPLESLRGRIFKLRLGLEELNVRDSRYTLMFEDITPLHRTFIRLQRTNRALRTLSECNQIVIRTSGERELLQKICEAIVRFGGYPLAWVGFKIHDQHRSVRLMAKAGETSLDLEQAPISWGEDRWGQGPTGVAMRTGEPVVINDTFRAPTMEPWRAVINQYGFAAGVSLPLRLEEGEVLGTLSLYAKEAGAFDQEEVDLLLELAGDLSFGISSLRTREQHRLAQESLRLSEWEKQLILDSISETLIFMSRDLEILWANRAAGVIAGRAAGELIGRRCHECWHGSDQPCPGCPGMAAIASGQVQQRELTHADGSCWKTTCYPVRDERGELVGVLELVENITEVKRAAEALQQQLAFQRTLLDTIPNPVFYKDRQGRYLGGNRAFAEFTGRPLEDLVGKTALEVFPPELGEFYVRKDRELFDSGGLQTYIFQGLHADNTLHMVLYNKALFHDHAGRVAGLVGVMLDITAGLHAEEELAREKERLAVTLASIGDGVISTDAGGRIVLINRVARELTGWGEQECLGQPLEEVLRLRDEKSGEPVTGLVRRVLQAGELVQIPETMLLESRDGRRVLVSDSAAPVRNALGQIQGAVVVFRDMTERRKAAEELQRSERLESLGLLAGGIAHDFNNILTAIMGNLALARMYVDADSPSERVLEQGEKACQRARDLTQQLLTFSRGGAPVKQAASLAELIRDSAGFALRGSNVSCRFELDPHLRPAEVDRGQISQVLHNLVINAVQAMPAGGTITISARNVRPGGPELPPLPAGAWIEIAVADQGPGIPEELRAKIFDPYFTTKPKGSGLGLATAYSIVRRHGGSLVIRSSPGQGATFLVYLPSSRRRTARRPAPETPGPLPANPLRVLLMDDEPAVREVVARMLEQLGHAVECAAEGEEALALYRRAREECRPFDAVILDLTIPGGMGGAEALRRLRELDPAVQAIVSSGYSTDPVLAEYRRHGFREVLVKPFRLQELVRAIAGITRRGGRGRQSS